MSTARANLLKEVEGLEVALASTRIGAGSGLTVDPGVRVLRRGATIAGLVVLESFLRSRIEELLKALGDWPAQYEDLPKELRRRATLDALPHIEKFARMLIRQGDEYEEALLKEIKRMASVTPPAFQFTRFLGGDYTGNISDAGTTDLLQVFQVKNCWASMQSLSADVGFGVPSVREVLRGVIRNRHRSAHVAAYVPAANDVVELPHNLRLISICMDSALSASVEVAIHDWRSWVADGFDWRTRLEIYFSVPSGSSYRVVRKGSTRATRVVGRLTDAKGCLPKKAPGFSRLLVHQGGDGRPQTWDIA